ncbi:membrane protein [Bacillus phage Bastille]|uniref:Holin n=6 Tax=Bastillevirus TaxID=1918010 RepID=A0A024B0A4_9CAUD|nr:membrane protein [Bacillus phage Bastille]YP_009035262.1 membrane protein [Bacillus phage Hoody T]YP_009035589.1 membrane protein [Bacillus phage Evoli]YP_009036969.1 membrane protein [Bacillus phage CAM003]AMW61821.1 hypothetical protein DNAM5_70 [Bacillus phage Vinny]ASR79587.1 hypothetical protein OTK52_67 [Bacillus phage OTooleKemple52]ASR79745.1 hypothetical protein JANET_67 [Bacillus phage Janet]ASU00917.1 hypothetical protein ANTHONY_70 [Bacillus phage Anthony]AXQ67284.1 hypotheti
MVISKHTRNKLLLIFLAQVIGYEAVQYLSSVGVEVESSTVSYFVTGGVFALITLGIYDYVVTKNAMKVQKEFSLILNCVLKRYDTVAGHKEKGD